MTEMAAWFSLPGRTVITLTGRDRASFLNGFCTNDIKGLTPGQSCEAFITTHQAKVVAWGQVTAWEDHLRVTAEPSLGPKLAAFLTRYIVSEDVELSDESAAWMTILVVGGEESRLAKLCAPAVDCPGTAWPLRRGRLMSVAGRPVWVERRAWVTTADWWLEMAAATATTVEQALTEAGWQPGSAGRYEVLRIAAGIPHYGLDIDDSNLPQEVNRTDQAISFTKGCYTGQETVARIRTYGHVNRLLVRLRGVQGPMPQAPGDLRGQPLRQGKIEVGRITSAAVDSATGTLWALGYVRRGAEAAGTQLEVQSVRVEVMPARSPAS